MTSGISSIKQDISSAAAVANSSTPAIDAKTGVSKRGANLPSGIETVANKVAKSLSSSSSQAAQDDTKSGAAANSKSAVKNAGTAAETTSADKSASFPFDYKLGTVESAQKRVTAVDLA